jgi:hypothetical protein
VSVRLNSIIQHNTAIQYAVELEAHGLVACPGNTLAAATSIRMLKEQQEAWRCGQWRAEQVDCILPRYFTYQFRSGIWAFDRLTAAGNANGLSTALPTTITCLRLVSSATTPNAKANEKSQWSLDLDVPIRAFRMDPVIDLLVLVEQTTDR